MAFLRLSSSVLALTTLPLLAACNQTAAPPDSGQVGASAIAAIQDAQAANASAMLGVAMAGHVGGLDPTRVGGMASSQIVNHQMNVANEKNLKMLEEVQKIAKEAERLKVQHEAFERQQAAQQRPKP
ncbi:hypothetical protein [Microvirga arsenatis]|uniref:Lipoprotein n=1 Tax=Microvirga arsenatis TaxID=2692265 RepID=A0ABW9Z5E7_9HYPH|nr:hypothetical protein [Microvirga arsenatis]NBJ12375.1 hypothetical protein [Microvirga arsenatis]NBJ26166.1 hypothetical protein [Microvirga arsenatis]